MQYQSQVISTNTKHKQQPALTESRPWLLTMWLRFQQSLRTSLFPGRLLYYYYHYYFFLLIIFVTLSSTASSLLISQLPNKRWKNRGMSKPVCKPRWYAFFFWHNQDFYRPFIPRKHTSRFWNVYSSEFYKGQILVRTCGFCIVIMRLATQHSSFRLFLLEEKLHFVIMQLCPVNVY